jgi:HAD domain in Swiss Army Knife RNA repair proteins
VQGLAAPYHPAPMPRTADVVLYVDLDGVVQHEYVMSHPRRGIYMCPQRAPGRTLFEWLPLLSDALAPFPGVRCVLSSSWCIRPGYAQTLKRFPEELRSRFIGGTFHRRVHGADPWLLESFRSTPRGLQIWADVQRRQPRQWLALDDDSDGWPTWARDNLVSCDGSLGLSSDTTREELMEKLKRCHLEVGLG